MSFDSTHDYLKKFVGRIYVYRCVFHDLLNPAFFKGGFDWLNHRARVVDTLVELVETSL